MDFGSSLWQLRCTLKTKQPDSATPSESLFRLEPSRQGWSSGSVWVKTGWWLFDSQHTCAWHGNKEPPVARRLRMDSYSETRDNLCPQEQPMKWKIFGNFFHDTCIEGQKTLVFSKEKQEERRRALKAFLVRVKESFHTTKWKTQTDIRLCWSRRSVYLQNQRVSCGGASRLKSHKMERA